MSLQNRDLLCSQEWTTKELQVALDLATQMKHNRFSEVFRKTLRDKTFLMLFYNPSTRTRISFECAATELGGHAQYIDARTIRVGFGNLPGETIEDAARVMGRYAAGIGIRLLEDQIRYYGEGDEILRSYAQFVDMPVISMAHDRFHPCQGLADIMGWAEWWHGDANQQLDLSVLRGRRLLITWASGVLARSWSSVQEALLIGSRFGMDITLAHPSGYDLDPEVIQLARNNCTDNNRSLTETLDPVSGYEGAHIVYARNWISPQAYAGGCFRKQEEVDKARQYREWICDVDKMRLTDNAIFSHPMPVDRGHEVTDEVASGTRSCIYDVAENRLHIQKAILALTIGQTPELG